MKEIRTIFSIIILVIIIFGCKSESSEPSTEEEITEPTEELATELDETIDQFGWYTGDNYLYGLKDNKGNVLVEPQFQNVGMFVDGWAAVFSEEFHGFCDTNGNLESLPPGLFFANYFSEMGGGYFFKGNTQNRYIITNSTETKYGFITENREIIAPCIYDYVEEFSEDLAVVKRDSLFGYINLKGAEVIQLKYEYAKSFKEGLAGVKQIDEPFGFINTNGIYVIEPTFNSVDEFVNGLCFVYPIDQEGISFINKKGEIVIPGPFEMVLPFYGETTLVQEGEDCYYINKTGKKTEDGDCEDFYIGC